MNNGISISVVIPSRNRPVLLQRAVHSVLAQTLPGVEIIVVNDGSDGDCAAAYVSIARDFGDQIRMLNLEQTEKGHGQSYAINRGVESASGDFVTFLDDDDFWTDHDHLRRAVDSISAAPGEIDLYYTNQAAYLGEERVHGPLWLEELGDSIGKAHSPDAAGAYRVSIAELMSCKGFQHLNTSLVRRSLYLSIGGMDENIRYECDWDFYLRCVDAARAINYFPGVTSHHNAPDPTKTLNMSTVVTSLQKLLFRSYVMDKAVLFSKSKHIREAATQHKTYTLKRITAQLVSEGNYKLAAMYARESLSAGFNAHWLAYCCYLSLRAIGKR